MQILFYSNCAYLWSFFCIICTIIIFYTDFIYFYKNIN